MPDESGREGWYILYRSWHPLWSPISSECTVGGKTAVEARAHAGTQVAADAGCTHEANLGLNLAEKVDEHGGMWIRGIGVEAFVFYLIYYICAVGENLLFDTVELVADYEGFKFDPEFVGKYTALGQELEAHIGYAAFIVFAVYYQIIIVCHSFY